MGVKPELAFDVCWEVYRGAREVLETKRGISALNWSPAERMGGGFRAGRKGRARRAGLGVAHGAVPPLLPGPRAV